MKEKLAWLAGLIDGEGCFTVGVHQNYKKSLTFQPVFTIDMIEGDWHIKVVNILKENNIRFNSFICKRQGSYQIRRIVIQSRECIVRLCNLLLPFSLIKTDQIKLFSKTPIGRQIILQHDNRWHKKLTGINWGVVNNWVNFIEKSRTLNAGHKSSVWWTKDRILNFYQIIARENNIHASK